MDWRRFPIPMRPLPVPLRRCGRRVPRNAGGKDEPAVAEDSSRAARRISQGTAAGVRMDIFPPAFVLSLVLMIAAVVMLLHHWQRFSDDSASVVAVENWVWLLAAWIGLKCVHETAHGLVCLRYGGDIRETGFLRRPCLRLWPTRMHLPVVVSFARALIHTAAAGVYIESSLRWQCSHGPLPTRRWCDTYFRTSSSWPAFRRLSLICI